MHTFKAIKAVFAAIELERQYQDKKHPPQDWPDVSRSMAGTPAHMNTYGLAALSYVRGLKDKAFESDNGSWLHLVVCEVAELAYAATQEAIGRPEHGRNSVDSELVQVAATVVAWMQWRAHRKDTVHNKLGVSPSQLRGMWEEYIRAEPNVSKLDYAHWLQVKLRERDREDWPAKWDTSTLTQFMRDRLGDPLEFQRQYMAEFPPSPRPDYKREYDKALAGESPSIRLSTLEGGPLSGRLPKVSERDVLLNRMEVNYRLEKALAGEYANGRLRAVCVYEWNWFAQSGHAAWVRVPDNCVTELCARDKDFASSLARFDQFGEDTFVDVGSNHYALSGNTNPANVRRFAPHGAIAQNTPARAATPDAATPAPTDPVPATEGPTEGQRGTPSDTTDDTPHGTPFED